MVIRPASADVGSQAEAAVLVPRQPHHDCPRMGSHSDGPGNMAWTGEVSWQADFSRSLPCPTELSHTNVLSRIRPCGHKQFTALQLYFSSSVPSGIDLKGFPVSGCKPSDVPFLWDLLSGRSCRAWIQPGRECCCLAAPSLGAQVPLISCWLLDTGCHSWWEMSFEDKLGETQSSTLRDPSF